MNEFLKKNILMEILNGYTLPIIVPTSELIFLTLLTENFICKPELFERKPTGENPNPGQEIKEINVNNVCVKPYDDGFISKRWNKAFSSRNISMISSDLFNMRYGSTNTDCFINEYENEYSLIQVIGNANNYSSTNNYKKSYSEALLYGATIDLYGKYDDIYSTFVICLDNSKFFNSILEDNYKSRAIFEYSNNKKKKLIQRMNLNMQNYMIIGF